MLDDPGAPLPMTLPTPSVTASLAAEPSRTSATVEDKADDQGGDGACFWGRVRADFRRPGSV